MLSSRTGPATAQSDFETARAIALTHPLSSSLARDEEACRSLVQTGPRDLPTLAISAQIAEASAT